MTESRLLRVGRRVPRHVYEGDEPLFTAPNEALAREIVEAVNWWRGNMTNEDVLVLVATRWPGWRLVPPNAPPTVATNGTAAAPSPTGKPRP